VKAAPCPTSGARLASFSEQYPITRPAPGRAEQSPEHWRTLVDKAVAHVTHALPEAPISGALTSQVNTHVFVDARGVPLLPAITWQDTRAAAEAAELDAQLTVEQKIAWLGAPIPVDASHPLARMLWVSRHHPDLWERTAHVLLPKDDALRHLTGEIATDPLSNIGLVGADGRYVADILALVPGAAERMAPMKGLTETLGTTAGGTPIACATMDGWVGTLGAGASHDGAAAYLSGTSEILGIASHTVTNTPGIVVFAEAETLRLHLGPTQSGGASQAWASQITGVPLVELAAQISEPRGMTPLFLPQLAGERAPLWDPSLRGAFLGLDASMGPPEIVRAVYEGVALSARHVFEELEASTACRPDTLTCGGGGFRAAPWGQIRADILGKRLQRLAINEPGLVGAACLALVHAGGAPTLGAAHRIFAATDITWEPKAARRGLYDDLYGTYRDALAQLAPLARQLRA